MKIVIWILLNLIIISPSKASEITKDENAHYAFGPYASYDTTYHTSVGGTIIKESENKYIDTYHIDGEITTAGYIDFESYYKKHIAKSWVSSLYFDYTTFFSPYYGQGISTKVANKKEIDQRQFEIKPNTYYEFSKEFSAGPFFDFHSREEHPAKQKDYVRYFPDETSLSFGFSALYDNRDSILDPEKGNKFELSISGVPQFLTTLKNQSSFAQVKMDLRKYIPLNDTVLATRFAYGRTLGRASYLYQYKIGGSNYLRGYEENRFIGNQFVTAMIEERVKLYKNYLAATASYEVGSVTEKFYDKRRSCYGLGLRVAMPPEWVDKLTANFSFGNDQKNIEMEFNENF